MSRRTPPLHPGCIRIAVHLDGSNERLLGDYVVSKLPKGLNSLGTVSTTPMVQGTELGAAVARSIFAVALGQENYPVALLAAIWICLHGPIDARSGISLTIDDLRKAAGAGVLAVTVSEDGCQWDYMLRSRHHRSAGGRMIPLDPNLHESGSIH